MNIWIDIDNSPHVPFFLPIIRELKARGNSICITTREYAQTIELLEQAGLEYKKVGEHAGKNKLKKILNLIRRSWKLSRAVRSFKPDLAISHGSRAQSIASKLLGIPKLTLFDYEWSEMTIFKHTSTLMACPHVLGDTVLGGAGLPLGKIRKYHGLKEEVYLPDFVPDPGFRASIGIPDDKIFVVVRPSSMTSNYHDDLSETILAVLLRKISGDERIEALITPRTEVDRNFAREIIAGTGAKNIHFAEKALPGTQLLYWADAVVSGGGTMNREAALLDTPTYSMFTGARPAIDEYLAGEHKLTFIEKPEQVDDIVFRKKSFPEHYSYSGGRPLPEIIGLIETSFR